MSEVVAGTKVRCASIEPARWRPQFPAATHAVTRTESSSWAGSSQVTLANGLRSRDLSPWLGVKRGACGWAPP